MLRVSLAALGLLAALPAAAQDRGGMHMRNRDRTSWRDRRQPRLPAVLDQRDGGRQQGNGDRIIGAAAARLFWRRRIVRLPAAGQHPGRHRGQPGAGSWISAGQTIEAQGPSGVLATTTYTRGYNFGYGACPSPISVFSTRPVVEEASMSRCSRAATFAVLSILWCGVSASAETLRCQSVNGNLNCAGSGGVSCQTVNGKTGLHQRPWRRRSVLRRWQVLCRSDDGTADEEGLDDAPGSGDAGASGAARPTRPYRFYWSGTVQNCISVPTGFRSIAIDLLLGSKENFHDTLDLLPVLALLALGAPALAQDSGGVRLEPASMVDRLAWRDRCSSPARL